MNLNTIHTLQCIFEHKLSEDVNHMSYEPVETNLFIFVPVCLPTF